jgi:hypothetical protein
MTGQRPEGATPMPVACALGARWRMPARPQRLSSSPAARERRERPRVPKAEPTPAKISATSKDLHAGPTVMGGAEAMPFRFPAMIMAVYVKRSADFLTLLPERIPRRQFLLSHQKCRSSPASPRLAFDPEPSGVRRRRWQSQLSCDVSTKLEDSLF